MFKKVVFTAAILMLGSSGAFAAGGEINGQVVQQSSVKNSKVIGASSAAINLEEIPVIGTVLEGKIDASMSINDIDNAGKIDGTVFQNSTMQDAVVISSQINTLKNEKNATIGEQAVVFQDSDISGEGSVVVGATINKIRNHK